MSYSLDPSSAPLIAAITSNCLLQYKEALDYLFNTNSPYVETKEELEHRFIHDLIGSYVESANGNIKLSNVEVTIDPNKLS